eukprot:3851681-Prymnesium_polylepis.1
MIHSTNGANMMGYNAASNANLLSWQSWQGFYVDVIDWVATRAGFTYELHSPSGEGPACVAAHNKERSPQQFATQYNCGAEDVNLLNRTHVYWSDYYVTSGRLQQNLFSVPMLADVGLTLVLAPNRGADIWEAADVMLKVFKPDAWMLCIAIVLVFSLTLWFVDHGGPTESTRETLNR